MRDRNRVGIHFYNLAVEAGIYDYVGGVVGFLTK